MFVKQVFVFNYNQSQLPFILKMLKKSIDNLQNCQHVRKMISYMKLRLLGVKKISFSILKVSRISLLRTWVATVGYWMRGVSTRSHPRMIWFPPIHLIKMGGCGRVKEFLSDRPFFWRQLCLGTLFIILIKDQSQVCWNGDWRICGMLLCS